MQATEPFQHIWFYGHCTCDWLSWESPGGSGGSSLGTPCQPRSGCSNLNGEQCLLPSNASAPVRPWCRITWPPLNYLASSFQPSPSLFLKELSIFTAKFLKGSICLISSKNVKIIRSVLFYFSVVALFFQRSKEDGNNLSQITNYLQTITSTLSVNIWIINSDGE